MYMIIRCPELLADAFPLLTPFSDLNLTLYYKEFFINHPQPVK